MRSHSRSARRAVFCAAAALWLAWPSAAAADLPLRFYTEEYPPVTFAKDGKASGLASEVVQEIQQRLHSEAPIEVVPWARGYRYATTEPNVGLFATTRTPERELLFKWVGPISATVGQLYVRRGGQGLKSLDDARHVKRILVPREWYLHQILREMGFSNLEPVATPADALRMLSAGRGDAAALDDVTIADSAVHGGVAAADIDRGPLITHAVQYIAFSQGTSDELVARWQATLDVMRQDGSFERIFKRWLPGSPLPPLR
jgi:polar amino acid transport system substrate-binding protein